MVMKVVIFVIKSYLKKRIEDLNKHFSKDYDNFVQEIDIVKEFWNSNKIVEPERFYPQ